MDLRSIFISNGVGIVLLLLLLYISRTRILRRQTEDRIYSYMIVGVLIACCMEILSYVIDGQFFPGARVLNYVINTYLYTVNLLLSFFVLVYVDLGLFGDTTRIWKKYKPHIIITLVMFVINIVNLFVPVSFIIDAQNVYARTPVSYVYYVIILFDCLTALVVSLRYERNNGARAFFNIGMFLVPIILGSGIQFLFYGLSLAWLSAAIGLTGLFMMQQNEMAYIDALVDTYNRQYLNHILSAWTKRGFSFTGAMLDIDHFKRINDQYGHSEGDHALKTVVHILKDSRRENEWIFRFAGDEFIVLKMSESADGLDAFIERMQQNLAAHNQNAKTRYPLVLSYGTSFCSDKNLDAFIKDMDDRMYEMKAAHHKAEA